MRKFCRFLSIFVLLFLLITTGCSSSKQYYFEFLSKEISVCVGEEINVKTIEVRTNLPNFEIVNISIENVGIAIVEGTKITAISNGTTKVKVTVKFDENYYQADFNLTVTSTSRNISSLSVTFEVYEINLSTKVVVLSVFKNGISYYDYSVAVLEGLFCEILFKTKLASFYEITFTIGSEFEIKFVDNLDLTNFYTVNSTMFE